MSVDGGGRECCDRAVRVPGQARKKTKDHRAAGAPFFWGLPAAVVNAWSEAYLTSTSAPASVSCCFRGFGLLLGDAFLQRLRGTVHEVLGFLQAQAGELPSRASPRPALLAPPDLEDHVEGGLLLGRAAVGAAGTRAATATAAAAGSIWYSSFRYWASSLTSFTVRPTSWSPSDLMSAIVAGVVWGSRYVECVTRWVC